MKHLLTLLLLVCSCGAHSVALGQALPTLTLAEAHHELATFRHALEEAHGGLYWYTPKPVMDSLFHQAEDLLAEGMDVKTFFDAIAPIHGAIRCGHTWLSVPDAWNYLLETKPLRMPFNLYFEEDKAFLMHDLTLEEGLPMGHEVLSLNGIALQEAVEHIYQFVPGDGFNTTSRRGLMAGGFSKLWATFVQADSVFSVLFKDPTSGHTYTLKVPGTTDAQADSLVSVRYANSGPAELPFWELEMQQQGQVGYFRMATFDSDYLKYKGIKHYKRALKKVFKEIEAQQPAHLILDLRGNGGGDDNYGAILCRYLIGSPFRYFTKMELSTRRLTYLEHSSEGGGLNLLLKLARKDKDNPGRYVWKYHLPLRLQQPKRHGYQGQVWVLTDGGTFSTAADVCAILHANGRATFVGEEVGGGYYGNTSAIITDVNLHHTGITLYMPLVRYTNAVDRPEWHGHGVVPAHQVPYTYASYAAGKDAQLARVQELIKSSGVKKE